MRVADRKSEFEATRSDFCKNKLHVLLSKVCDVCGLLVLPEVSLKQTLSRNSDEDLTGRMCFVLQSLNHHTFDRERHWPSQQVPELWPSDPSPAG